MRTLNTKHPSLKLHTVIEGVIFDPRDAIPKYKNFDVRNDPLYICDIVSPQDLYVAIANCYQIDEDSLKQYQESSKSLEDVANLTKAHKTTYDILDPYGKYPVTKLAKAAKHLYDKHPRTGYTVHTQPALFSSIVTRGTDTFSHKQGEVIHQRLESRHVYNARKHIMKLKPGRLTHVVIGLEDNFLPVRKYMPSQDILHQLTQDTNSILGMYLGF